MRLKAPASVKLTPTMEKRARLEALFRQSLQQQSNDGINVPTILLLAQSLDSPVAMAVENIVFSDPSRTISVRIILTRINATSAINDDAPTPTHTGVSCRILRDSRFGEAHEQVILGTSTVWIGDSMRRDPTKRDSLESFFENDSQAATNAAASFERLWNLAHPVRVSDLASSKTDTEHLDTAATAQMAISNLIARIGLPTRR